MKVTCYVSSRGQWVQVWNKDEEVFEDFYVDNMPGEFRVEAIDDSVNNLKKAFYRVEKETGRSQMDVIDDLWKAALFLCDVFGEAGCSYFSGAPDVVDGAGHEGRQEADNHGHVADSLDVPAERLAQEEGASGSDASGDLSGPAGDKVAH